MKRQMEFARNRALTLVEMIALAALIVILVALLMVSGQTMMGVAHRAQCASNLRQLGVAVLNYCANNNGAFPPYLYSAQKDEETGEQWRLAALAPWSTAAAGDIDHVSTMLCPGDRNVSPIATTDGDGNHLSIASSYGYNFFLNLRGKRLPNVSLPTTVIFFDGKPGAALGELWWGDNRNGEDMGKLRAHVLDRRHGSKISVQFLDGHVELVDDLQDEWFFPQ